MKKTNEIATMKVGNPQNTVNKPLKKTVKRRYANRKSLIEQTAQITGYSEVYVRKVTAGERSNSEVETVYMELVEGGRKLVEAVKTLLPFQGPKDIELVVKYYSGPEADRLQEAV